MASTPRSARYSRRLVTPGRSPRPSPSESVKLRGYTWYTTAAAHHGLLPTLTRCPFHCDLDDSNLRGGVGKVGVGGVWIPGGSPGLQNQRAACRVAGGVDFRPPPPPALILGAGRPGRGRPASGAGHSRPKWERYGNTRSHSLTPRKRTSTSSTRQRILESLTDSERFF